MDLSSPGAHEHRDAELARRIAERAGLRPLRVEPILGLGRTNHVFVVISEQQRHVVRFALDPMRSDSYVVEAWCLAEAAARGIPSPGVVAVGTESGVPFLVETFVEGDPATPGGLVEWRALGTYGKIIHGIPLGADAPDGLFSRFGRDLEAAWHAHLTYNLESLDASDPLLALGVYPQERQPVLRALVERLGRAQLRFGLNHGDLSVRNLLLDDGRRLVLLDWDTAATGPVPDGDLLSLMRMHQAEEDPRWSAVEAFAEGYSLDLSDVLPRLRDQLVLGHLDLVRWARERRPDLLAETVAASRVGIERNLVDG